MKALLAGQPLLVAEYRRGAAETISYRDKKTGKAASLVVLRHTLETESKSLAVSEFVEVDKIKVETWKQPFAKGTKVVVHLTGLEEKQGATTCKGTIETLEQV